MHDPYLDFTARRKLGVALTAKVGSTITVRLMAGADLAGTLTAFADDTLTLTVGAAVWTIPIQRLAAFSA